MTVTRKNVEFAKKVFIDRLGDPYVYGGNWDPLNLKTGTDCSGLVGDCLDAVILGTAMPWQRSVTTESWAYDYANNRPAAPGAVGPKGSIAVASLADVPADAAVVVNIHHGGGGEDSHTQCIVDGWVMESNGDHGTCTTGTGAMDPNSGYWTDHWYLPGPIVEDGTPRQVLPGVPTVASDTLWADVSEFQKPLDDSYWEATYVAGNGVTAKYRWIEIRSNDGSHQDANFAANYAAAVRALNDGRADGMIVYFYWRPGNADVDTHIAMVQAAGGPHPRMVSMMDVESGGNPGGDESPELNSEHDRLVTWLGNFQRVIAYANLGDARAMWVNHPDEGWILAGYGSNPSDPLFRKIAHQYTDGQGYGGGLPEGAPPFGNCDMNSADGFTSAQLAVALGIATNNPAPAPAPTPAPTTPVSPPQETGMLGSVSIYATPGEGAIYTGDQMQQNDDGFIYEDRTEKWASRGDVDAMTRILKAASKLGPITNAAIVAYAQATLADLKAANPDRFAATLAQIEQANPAVLQAFLSTNSKGN